MYVEYASGIGLGNRIVRLLKQFSRNDLFSVALQIKHFYQLTNFGLTSYI